MKKKVFFFLSLSLIIQANAQIMFCLRNDTLRPLTYSGGDEFNSATINEEAWGRHLWPKTNMAQNFAYDPNNSRIENGVAVFSLSQKDSIYIINPTEVDSNFIRQQKLQLNNHQFYLKYAAGSIISKQKYHYGLYELRFKIEKGKGVWPAFWFFGGNKNEEIDVFELKGERGNEIHVDTHCPYGCDRGYKNKLGLNTNWGNWMPVSNYLNEGFNIMLLDWREDELIWYINGYPLAYFKGKFSNPMNLFINTQVASAYSAFQPGPDETTICPNAFYVDYIRQWKELSAKNTPALIVSNGLNLSDRFSSDYFNKPLKQSGLMYNSKKFKEEQGMVSLVRLSQTKILVNTIGKINQAFSKIDFVGEYGDYHISQLGMERVIEIDGREKMLELILYVGKKKYLQKILLK